MKIIKPSKLEWFSFYSPIPFIIAILNLILYEEQIWKDYRVWTISAPVLFAITIASWYIHLLYTRWVQQKYPHLSQSKIRILHKALIMVFVMTPSIVLIFFVYDSLHILGYHFQSVHLLKGLLLGFCINTVFETLYEADYIFLKYREAREEKNTIAEMAMNEEFDKLKNQVNPHFLFNCFNTLSSLISVDKTKAEIFLDELSKVYRYLFQNNAEGVTTLEKETTFLHSYAGLLKTRHGEALQLRVIVDKKFNCYKLPSLSLQLLVENVVKHNMLSKSKPLIIEVCTTPEGMLTVKNNLQLRLVSPPSNKVGLENIKAKYELLKQPGFKVIDNRDYFKVLLPLITPDTFNA